MASSSRSPVFLLQGRKCIIRVQLLLCLVNLLLLIRFRIHAVHIRFATDKASSSSFHFPLQGAAALEAAQKVRIVVFDKTGTLTQGKPAVTSHKTFSSSHSEMDIMRLAAAAEASSEHPVAQAILEHSYLHTCWPHTAGGDDTSSKDAFDCKLNHCPRYSAARWEKFRSVALCSKHH